MYKIITDYSKIEAINEACRKRPGEGLTAKYCEEKKHPIKEAWVIPIDPELLKGYNLTFIDDLLQDVIETIPIGWDWPYQDRAIRVVMPLWVQARAQVDYANITGDKWDDLGQLITNIYPNIPQFIITDATNVYIYLEELQPIHKALLGLFDDIIIETKP